MYLLYHLVNVAITHYHFCIMKVFPKEFLESETAKKCSKTKDNVLKEFVTNLGVNADFSSLREKCEDYCSKEEKCWGCSLHCESSCQLDALSDCEMHENTTESFKVSVIQKPGKHEKYLILTLQHFIKKVRLYQLNQIYYDYTFLFIYGSLF